MIVGKAFMSCYLMYLERITDSQAMRKLKFVYCLQIILWKKTQTHNFLQKKTKYEKLEMFCGWHVRLTKLKERG